MPEYGTQGLADGALSINQYVGKRIGPAAVATGAAAALGGATSGAPRAGRVNSLKVCNTTGGSLTITTHVVPKGGSAAAGNVLDVRAVAAGVTAEILGGSAGPLNLDAGDRIFMLSSGSGAQATMSYEIER